MKPSIRVPWSHRIIAQLAGLPDNTPVIEMDQEFHVDVLPVDYKQAKRHDPCHCALANAAHRQCGLPAKVFPVITSGKVGIPMRRGQKFCIALYAHTKQTHAGLVQFDKTGKFPAEGMTFKPLPPSLRWEYKRAAAQARNKKRKDKRSNHTAKKRAALKSARVFRPLSGAF